MRQRSRLSLVLVAVLIRAGGARATTGDVGVLERLSVPPVPVVDRSDARSSGPQQATDAIAVPTPTAAGSGLVVMGGLILWRAGRRVIGRI